MSQSIERNLTALWEALAWGSMLGCQQVEAEGRTVEGELEERGRGTERGRREHRAPGMMSASSAPQPRGARKTQLGPQWPAGWTQAWLPLDRVLWGSYSGKRRNKELKILNNKHLHLENYGQLLPAPTPPWYYVLLTPGNAFMCEFYFCIQMLRWAL